MKVTIVSPCDLPIPATKGGAIATLIEVIIQQNERKKLIDLTVISSYDKMAHIKSKDYKNTKFVFIKQPIMCRIIDYIYEFLYKLITKKEHKILKNYAWKLYVIHFLKKHFTKNETDKIVLENSGYLLNVLKYSKIFNKNNIYYHLHNDIPDNININYLKKCKLLLISNYLEIKIKKMCGPEIEKNIFILKNGFNCNVFNKQLSQINKEKLKKELGINNQKKIIIYAGRITQEKGILELTNAFQKLNDDNLVLLVVGSHNFGGKNTTSFEKKMKQKFSMLGEKIKFTGYVPYNDIWKYYKIADLAVLPSIWNEPAGLTMLEATASGLPLITTNGGGIPEYLDKNTVTMLKIDENIEKKLVKAIKNYFENEKKYQIQATKASNYVIKKYNAETFYNDFVKYMSD